MLLTEDLALILNDINGALTRGLRPRTRAEDKATEIDQRLAAERPPMLRSKIEEAAVDLV